MESRTKTCVHSIDKENGKYVCDISGFEVDGCHCSGCASYKTTCDICKKNVLKEDLQLIDNKYICKDCLNGRNNNN